VYLKRRGGCKSLLSIVTLPFHTIFEDISLFTYVSCVFFSIPKVACDGEIKRDEQSGVGAGEIWRQILEIKQ
jgi:hypothetical protein